MVFPRFKYPTGDPPIGPLTLLAFIRKEISNLEYRFFDATFNPSLSAIKDLIQDFRPDITGIYTSTLMYDDALRITRIAKKYQSFVVIGGPHASVLPETLINNKNVDALILGEAELPLLHLLKYYPDIEAISKNSAILLRNYRDTSKGFELDLLKDLDDLPIPAYDLIDMNLYMKNWFQLDVVSPLLMGTNILASRGCPYQCSFCQPTLDIMFGKKVRIRSPESIIKELKYLKRTYNLNSFVLADDTPTYFKNWIIKFSELLIKERLGLIWGCNTRLGMLDDETFRLMKRSGFRRLMIGLESASQRILDDIYHKGIKIDKAYAYCNRVKELGIRVFAYFMLGAPTETLKEVKKTINLAFILPLDEATFSLTTPLPGTNLEKYMKEKGYLINHRFSSYNYYSRVNARREIKSWILKLYQRIAFLKFYLHPKRIRILFNSLKSKSSMYKLYLKLKRIINF